MRQIQRLKEAIFSQFEDATTAFPSDEPMQPPKETFLFCLHYAKQMKWLLAFMTLLSISIAIVEVSLYAFLGDIIDWLSIHNRETFLEQEWSTLVIFTLITLVVLPILIILHSLTIHQGLLGNFPMSIRWLSHRYLLKQSTSFYQDEFAGRIATKVMQTALSTRETVVKILDVIVFISVYFLSMLILVAQLNLYLMLPLLIWLIAYIKIQHYFIPKLRDISALQADRRADMTGKIVDSYTNINTIKLFSHTQQEANYAYRGMFGFMETVYKQMRLVTGIHIFVQISNYALLLATTLVGVWLWYQQQISVGAVAIATGLALRLNGLSQWIMWELSMLFENIGTVTDGANTLAKPISVTDAHPATALQVTAGKIEFQNLVFDYNNQISVFKDFNLSIKPGEHVGLVGRSGAGKSTLVNLLLRLYDIDQGSITIDHQLISSVTQESLRKNIGVVTQDTALLHRSVRENITYGCPTATEAEIITAAKQAQAHDFILTLTDNQGRTGYDAQVGERGVKLSGGQRQRIAIARVLLKDAPIIILDEATSALDSEVEAAIQSNLTALIEGKTVIAIAHRLSTISAMDRLIILENGKIIEEGSHEQLISNKNGLYQQLWSLQSNGFISE